MLFQCKDDTEYQVLKKQLQFSELEMFIYLRNQQLLDDYVEQGAQYVHSRMYKFSSNMDWYMRYVNHYKCAKLMWVD